MDYYTLIGVDPGLIDTGVVAIHLDLGRSQIEVETAVVHSAEFNRMPRPPADVARDVQVEVSKLLRHGRTDIWIEQYRERGTVNRTNQPMRLLEQALQRALPGSNMLENMGSKKVLKRKLLKALHVDKFSTTTNHRDLEAAARIAVFGALKDPDLNSVITTLVIDHVDGSPWLLV